MTMAGQRNHRAGSDERVRSAHAKPRPGAAEEVVTPPYSASITIKGITHTAFGGTQDEAHRKLADLIEKIGAPVKRKRSRWSEMGHW